VFDGGQGRCGSLDDDFASKDQLASTAQLPLGLWGLSDAGLPVALSELRQALIDFHSNATGLQPTDMDNLPTDEVDAWLPGFSTNAAKLRADRACSIVPDKGFRVMSLIIR
jgi:hypothetical protein